MKGYSVWFSEVSYICENSYLICVYKYIGQVGRVFTNGPGDLGSIQTLKTVFDTSFLNTQQYKVLIKWSNPGKGVAPPSTPRCHSYWKGSLLVALDYGR